MVFDALRDIDPLDLRSGVLKSKKRIELYIDYHNCQNKSDMCCIMNQLLLCRYSNG